MGKVKGIEEEGSGFGNGNGGMGPIVLCNVIGHYKEWNWVGDWVGSLGFGLVRGWFGFAFFLVGVWGGKIVG